MGLGHMLGSLVEATDHPETESKPSGRVHSNGSGVKITILTLLGMPGQFLYLWIVSCLFPQRTIYSWKVLIISEGLES